MTSDGVDTVGVWGSNPHAPTIIFQTSIFTGRFLSLHDALVENQHLLNYELEAVLHLACFRSTGIEVSAHEKHLVSTP